MSKVIIGLTGEMAAGKSTCAKYLAEKYQAATFRFSTPIRDVLSRLYVPATRENLAAISLAVRQLFGQDLFSEIIAHDAAQAVGEVVAIDGVRRLPDVAALRKLPEFKLVYLEAEPRVRYERLAVRGENEDDLGKTWEQFQQDQNLETEAGIRLLKPAAQLTLDNNGTKEELYRQLDELVRQG